MAENNTATRVLEIARGEIGATSGDKYIEYYNGVTGIGLPYGVAWCAAWVTWVMRHAGVPEDSVLNYKGCATASDWFAERGRFMPRSSGYTPKPGDIIMYEWNPEDEGTSYDDGDDHTGIVEYVDGNVVHTIEGNNGGTCCRDWWSLGNAYISGYCVPLYNIEEKQEERDMTAAEARKIAQEEIAKKDPIYNTVEDVPSYWREAVQELVNLGCIRGTAMNPDGSIKTLGMSKSEIKSAVICLRVVQLLVGKQYATFEDLPEWAKPYVKDLMERGTLEGVEVKPDGTRVLNLSTIMLRLVKMLADKPETA